MEKTTTTVEKTETVESPGVVETAQQDVSVTQTPTHTETVIQTEVPAHTDTVVDKHPLPPR